MFVTRVTRLPLFAAGLGLVGTGLYSLIHSVVNGGQTVLNNPYEQVVGGLGMLSLASSMYLKDQDPKLLDKQPFWKKVYDTLREKVNSLLPPPIPELKPIPVRYRTVDDYVVS